MAVVVIAEVTMYRAVCDADDCGASAQDEGDYYAYSNPGPAVDEAVESDWYSSTAENGTITLLCPDHAPDCADPNCTVMLTSDEFGDLCEDHFELKKMNP